MNIAGVILAGGQSSRYGQPKMFEPFRGEALYKQSLYALQANQLHPIIIATNAKLQHRFEQEGIVFSIEQTMHQGPLAALSQVMHTYPNDWFFVVASDMPYMNATFVHSLMQYCTPDVYAVVPKQQAYIQTLAALYHRKTLPFIDALLSNNRRSIKALLAQVPVNYVPFADNEPTFININRQQDWPKEL